MPLAFLSRATLAHQLLVHTIPLLQHKSPGLSCFSLSPPGPPSHLPPPLPPPPGLPLDQLSQSAPVDLPDLCNGSPPPPRTYR